MTYAVDGAVWIMYRGLAVYVHTLPPCENGIAYIRRYVSGQKYTEKKYREMCRKAVLRNVSSAKQLPQPRKALVHMRV